MKDPLEILFQELTDTLEDTLPGTYWKDYRLRDRREDALLETLDRQQRRLLEDYQESEWDCAEQRERAVFLAAFQLSYIRGMAAGKLCKLFLTESLLCPVIPNTLANDFCNITHLHCLRGLQPAVYFRRPLASAIRLSSCSLLSPLAMA